MMPRLGIQMNARGEKILINTALGNIAASTTDATLLLEGATLTAVPGRRYYVLAIFAHLAGDVETNVTLNSKGSGAGTAISSTKQVAANGGWVQARGTPQDYLYRTKPGEALTVTTGAGSTVGLDLIVTIAD